MRFTLILRLTRKLMQGFRHAHVDLDDTEVADALALFPQCIDFVEGELAKGRGVLVHCHLGMSTCIFHSVLYYVFVS